MTAHAIHSARAMRAAGTGCLSAATRRRAAAISMSSIIARPRLAASSGVRAKTDDKDGRRDGGVGDGAGGLTTRLATQIDGEQHDERERQHGRHETRARRAARRDRLVLRLSRRRAALVADDRLVGDFSPALSTLHTSN